MKIRSIELTNIRRFAGRRASIVGIGDGITVLSEPNEFGKSTFFDALHALFFEKHRSTKTAVKSLQPHAGGAPEVELTVELPEGMFRLRKRWLTRATAQITGAQGKIIAQDDEAEAWIERLLGQGLAGPSGLLWVRQGLVGLEAEGSSAADRTERENSLSARRDLLSSVAGEIEMMTGGRRMDMVLSRVGADLARLATTTLRPKAGGDWARAVDEAAGLATERAQLAEKALRLSGELGRRALVQKDLGLVNDPKVELARQAEMQAARQAHDAALAHETRLGAARQSANLAALTAEKGAAEMERLAALSQRLHEAEKLHNDAAERALKADAAAIERQTDDKAAAVAYLAVQARARDLGQRMARAQQAKAAAAARLRSGQLAQLLTQAAAQQGLIERASAERVLIRVTDTGLAEAEKAQTGRDRLSARIDAASVSVSFAYSGAARALKDGAEVPEGAHALSARADFDLPGLGILKIDPGQFAGNPAADLAAADADLAHKLAACGSADLNEAKGKLSAARRLDEAVRTAKAVLAQIAPDGMGALREAHAKAEAEGASTEGPAEDIAALAADFARAEAAETAARNLGAEAHSRAVAAGETRAAALADRTSSARVQAAAKAEAGDPLSLSARLGGLSAAQIGLTAQADAARGAVKALEALPIDLETAAARLARASSADLRARNDRDRLQNELSTLNGSIGALADQGIEEALDDVTGRLVAAEARVQRYGAEVHALARLRAALDQARRAARDAYFGPVLRELEPLLAILHPGAHLLIDDQTLLPVALTRDGQEEALDILSGGTREQVAILTRLAFARLFAQAGRPVPVILDDALVHSDDDRIEAMFTALHRVARDQQILVLTCRQRAFASLGGARAQVVIEAV